MKYKSIVRGQISMIIQLVFTGNVRVDVATSVEQDSIELITSRCQQLNIGGTMFYSEGNFLLVLEGVKENVQALFDGFTAHPSLDAPLVLANRSVERRYFEEFKLSFSRKDMEKPIKDPLFLNRLTKDRIIPDNCPENIKAIVDSFLKVQQIA